MAQCPECGGDYDGYVPCHECIFPYDIKRRAEGYAECKADALEALKNWRRHGLLVSESGLIAIKQVIRNLKPKETDGNRANHSDNP